MSGPALAGPVFLLFLSIFQARPARQGGNMCPIYMRQAPRAARTKFAFYLILAVLLAFGKPCLADETATPQGDKSQDTFTVSEAGDTLSDADMSAKRGGTETNTITVTSQQTLNSTSTGNTVNVGGNLTNGAVTVGNNFGGSGFGSYVFNTGNNSTINSGVSVSVLSLGSGAIK
jgi:hypothetical protein